MKKFFERSFIVIVLGAFAVSSIVKLVMGVYSWATGASVEDLVFMSVFVSCFFLTIGLVLWFMYFGPKRKNEVTMPATGLCLFILLGFGAALVVAGITVLIVRIAGYFL